jgi:hypothetical protein
MQESERRSKPRVTEAIFIPDEASPGRMHIQVFGENFLARAVPLFARLGEQIVEELILSNDGRGFAGVLERTPQPGDRLFVGYADSALQSTDVVYPNDANPVS